MPLEQELKLTMAPEALPRLRRLPLLRSLAQGRARTRRLVTTYYDTPDLRLYKNALTLRVRRAGRQHIQTLKTLGDRDGGVANRQEWEQVVMGDDPDLRHLDETPIGAALGNGSLPDAAEALRPLFTTDLRRTTWLLHLGDGSEVEMALDVGEVTSERGRLPIQEAELELKSGQPSSLFTVARALHEAVGARLATRSKSSWGYELVGGGGPLPVKARPAELAASDTVATAFLAIARGCLGQLEANEACALRGEDSEGIHQMRVALRRLRSAFSLMKAALPSAAAQPLIDEIKWLFNELGPARDWDVFIAETAQPAAAAMPEEGCLDDLLAIAVLLRERAYQRAHAVLESSRFTELKLALGAWVADSDWRHHLAPEAAAVAASPVMDFAAAILGRHRRKLRRAGDDLAGMAPDDLHKLRIRAKKLRYAADFFRGLYPHKTSKRYAKALADLQDALGALNDAAVGRIRLGEIVAASSLGAGDPGLARACGIVTGWLAARAAGQRRELDALWRRFARRNRFWHKPDGAAG